VVQEEFLANMPEPDKTKTSEYKPPATAEEEEQRFTAFLGKFLEEDDESTAPAPTRAVPSGPSVPATTGGNVDIASEVAKALAARDKEKQSDERYENLSKEVAALKAPKRKKWWEPWSLFADS
jgi:hypothetical protein